MFTIDTTIDIAAPLARVHTAITTEAGYRAWWAQDTEFASTQLGSAERSLRGRFKEPSQGSCLIDGDQATFRFSRPDETRTVTFRVDRVDRNGIAMTCTAQENNPDWLGTRLEIELGETATGTRVHLAHAGYPARNEVYERCSEAWPHFLRSLASYMMTGTGQPYPKAA